MRLAASSIAWPLDQDSTVASLMRGLGYTAVELAPTKRWKDLTVVPPSEAAEYRRFWEGQGLPVVALQSIVFGRPDLEVFGSAESREAFHKYLCSVVELGAALGAQVLVFGSPKNRLKKDLAFEEALVRAAEFFQPVGDYAARHGVIIGFEPNPAEYGCDFVTNAEQGARLVEAVASPGFQLHLDMAGMSMAGDDIARTLGTHGSSLAHCHISAPQLNPVSAATGLSYAAGVEALVRSGFRGCLSLEMLEQKLDSDSRRQCLEYVSSLVYEHSSLAASKTAVGAQ
jgi:sugar phosphate isomerase/epimerase